MHQSNQDIVGRIVAFPIHLGRLSAFCNILRTGNHLHSCCKMQGINDGDSKPGLGRQVPMTAKRLFCAKSHLCHVQSTAVSVYKHEAGGTNEMTCRCACMESMMRLGHGCLGAWELPSCIGKQHAHMRLWFELAVEEIVP